MSTPSPSAVPSEERVASSVIKRLLSESDDGATISVSTAGKVDRTIHKYACI